MNEFLQALERALHLHAPSIHAGLRPAATDAQISSAEKVLGVKLPDDVRAAYRWHDGCSSELSIFVGNCQWCSLETMVGHWKGKISFCNADRKENPGNYPSYTALWDSMKVKPVWWNKRWIPIGVSNTVSSIYVDLDPAPAGTVGQIISDAGMQDAQAMAPGLGSFFRNLTKHLEVGSLVERPDGTWGEVKRRLPVWWSNFDWSK